MRPGTLVKSAEGIGRAKVADFATLPLVPVIPSDY